MLHTTSNFFNKYSLFLFTSESYNKVKRFKFLHFHFPLLFLVAKSAGSPADFAFPGEKFKYQFIGVINCVGLWPPSARRAQPFPRGEGGPALAGSEEECGQQPWKYGNVSDFLRCNSVASLTIFLCRALFSRIPLPPALATLPSAPSPRGKGCAFGAKKRNKLQSLNRCDTSAYRSPG